MLFSTLLAASAAVLASATPMPAMRIAEGAIDYNWTVTGWEAGCGHTGCYYHFSISAPPYTSYPQAPAFNASCSGQNEGGPWAACIMKGEGSGNGTARVSSRLRNTVRKANVTTPANFAVSLAYPVASGAVFNWTAYGTETYNQFIKPPQTFNITPSEVFGVI